MVPPRAPPVVFFFISTDKNILEKLKKSGFFIFIELLIQRIKNPNK